MNMTTELMCCVVDLMSKNSSELLASSVFFCHWLTLMSLFVAFFDFFEKKLV